MRVVRWQQGGLNGLREGDSGGGNEAGPGGLRPEAQV